MDTFTVVVIVTLILALIFFGVTILGSNKSSGSSQVGSGYAPSYVGGGCGR